MDSEGLRRSDIAPQYTAANWPRAARPRVCVGCRIARGISSRAPPRPDRHRCATASCEQAQQTALTTLLQPFTTLPGTAAWTANDETQQSIYLNSTYAQRVQSAQNAVLANAQNPIWLSNNTPSPFAANVRAAPAIPSVMAAFGSAGGQTSR